MSFWAQAVYLYKCLWGWLFVVYHFAILKMTKWGLGSRISHWFFCTIDFCVQTKEKGLKYKINHQKWQKTLGLSYFLYFTPQKAVAETWKARKSFVKQRFRGYANLTWIGPKRGKPLRLSYILYFTPPGKWLRKREKHEKALVNNIFAHLPTSHESGRNQLPGDVLALIGTLSGGGEI